MTLGFSQTANGEPTHFVEKIWEALLQKGIVVSAKEMAGIGMEVPELQNHVVGTHRPKLHTIRQDKKDRWHKSRLVHAVINNRTKDRFQFVPTFFCGGVQQIEISSPYGAASMQVKIDGEIFGEYHYGWDVQNNEAGLLQLAHNDGFDDIESFHRYFESVYDDGKYRGKIIHFTDLKYAS